MADAEFSISGQVSVLERYYSSRLGISSATVSITAATNLYIQELCAKAGWKLEIKNSTRALISNTEESVNLIWELYRERITFTINGHEQLGSSLTIEIENSIKNPEQLPKINTKSKEKLEPSGTKHNFLFVPQVIAYAVWAVVGLLIWIPILIRSNIIASSALMLSAFSEIDKKWIYRMLNYSNTFYIAGFRSILYAADGNVASEIKSESLEKALLKFCLECGFAIVFYSVTIKIIF
ncbi:hypothetical protein [Minwuia thermotolerans]|uniref:hypothetical protein n=1 Tax=Minwuia thermotolerans TaxID=2056226 RepID=UPI000F63E0FF|nr:hypothetical protein [Minwuia thermotolerans]